jgi:DNA-directed RNA polymerase subunit beta
VGCIQNGFPGLSAVFDGAEEDEIAAELSRAWLMDRAWEHVTDKTWEWLAEEGFEEDELEDETEARTLYMINWLNDDQVP